MSRPTPQEESKTSLLDTLRVKNHLFLTLETAFGLLLGDRPDSSETPEDSFLTFWVGEGLESRTPLPDRGDCKKENVLRSCGESVIRISF